MEAAVVLEHVRELSDEFARERRSRQPRRELLLADFDRLRDAGFLLTGVPTKLGGLWENLAVATRPVCQILRTLARGDSSVALVSAMHPAVLSFWLASPPAPEPFGEAWRRQCQSACEMARAGSWWGTITSEPGSGGDVARTAAVARPNDHGEGYLLSGQKHFGSGSGITSYMLTSAVAVGEAEPDWYFIEVRGAPWDGSTGMKLLAAWDGHGMTATQSHAFQFDNFPATRFARGGGWREVADACGSYVGCLFTSVIVGIVDAAIDTARGQLAGRRASLGAFEQVEWAQAELEGWLIEQAYEGMIRAVEAGDRASLSVVRGKTAIAGLAESVLTRICKIIGGGVYARQSPFGYWFEDVRALGFLRPPWGLAYDRLFEGSWLSTA